MITLNHVVRRLSQQDADGFRDFWLGEHAERSLQLAIDLGVDVFTKSETLHDDDVNRGVQQSYGTATDAYDFVDQMFINDLAAFKTGLANAGTKTALMSLHEREQEYVDQSRSDYWFSIEIPQIVQDDRCRATAENPLLKGFYILHRKEHLSIEEAQLHWRACHGSMARQFQEMLPFRKYVQGHLIESRVCAEIKSLLGGKFESSEAKMGQAEIWMDRRAIPGPQGPEAVRMMRLLVEDIALFAEPHLSHTFVGKEHVVLDRLRVPDRIPQLFTAN